MSAKDDRPVFEEEELVEAGVYVEQNRGENVGCDEATDRCAPDDYSEAPHESRNVPGTEDDVPYSVGTEESIPAADTQFRYADESTTSSSRPTPADEGDTESDISKTDERDLWRRNRALIEEDEDDGLKLEGFSEEEIPDVLDAMGDEAQDPIPDSATGYSATGSDAEAERGGFPEREK
jgi:hypothetical protein